MGVDYSVDIQNRIAEEIRKADLHRPPRVGRYERGMELTYDVTGLDAKTEGRVRLVVDKFVGGGFAGQVYRVKIVDIESAGGAIGGLEAGAVFAMKILVPPSGFSRFFRNFLYWVGFQGPFQLQVNPVAARAGALWQKFFRRAAARRFGDDRSVVDIHATFVDKNMGSCGELSDWVDGRTWRLEVDDRLDLLRKWLRRKPVDESAVGSPEFRAKREFMHHFVDLIHDVGGHEFARQYEWTTWKSQPNCLKWNDSDDDPAAGLVAVDFRAGLALLPYLPMSPGDFKLIFQGIRRGSLVQFDRGDLRQLERFVDTHPDDFEDMRPMLDELKINEEIYRNSVPDITHNHFRLLYSRTLWSTIFASAITGWTVTNLVGKQAEARLRKSNLRTFVFGFFGIIPFLGPFVRRLWGQAFWRKHYAEMLTSPAYFRRAMRAKLLEISMGWHRAGRLSDDHAERAMHATWRIAFQFPLSILPVRLHRLLTDWAYAKDRLGYYLLRPVRLYFKADLREEWLRDMVTDGRKEQLLSKDDADVILSRIDEPFIQKYLKSLAVHVCTLPVTQIVSVLIAIIYVLTHPDMPRAQAYSIGVGIIALFQVVPISPGSLARGFYVVYLVIRERNFKDYNIAVFLSFFKYVGYLAFPIQMAYRYPTLARFMAAHWATGAVHTIPVFGERGALLEHWVFSAFYNWPLTIRRRVRRRAELRATLTPRFWHVVPIAILGAGLFGLADYLYLNHAGNIPALKQNWWLVVIVPFVCGSLVTLGAGGASLTRRVGAGAVCGSLIGILSLVPPTLLGANTLTGAGDLISNGLWRVFLFTLMSTLGVLLTELVLPEPKG